MINMTEISTYSTSEPVCGTDAIRIMAPQLTFLLRGAEAAQSPEVGDDLVLASDDGPPGSLGHPASTWLAGFSSRWQQPLPQSLPGGWCSEVGLHQDFQALTPLQRFMPVASRAP